MDKLQVESKEATERFTVDLAESMHRKLSIVAAKTRRSKADIVRSLLIEVVSVLSDMSGRKTDNITKVDIRIQT